MSSLQVMTETSPRRVVAGDLRCATRSRAAGLDPIGTTGSHRGYLLGDVALPWPPDLAGLDEVAAAQSLLAGTGIRFQATVPGEVHRAVLYHPRPTVSGVSSPDLVRCETIVDARPGGLLGATQRLLDTAPGDASGPRREVLVCTHGRRDVCCGARGSRLHLELVSTPELLGVDVEVRRTSHTGGHRFAPTAVVLPEGTGWAYLDTALLGAIVGRSGPIEAVLGHYRGWSALGSARLQALERAVLGQVGWGLFDRPRGGLVMDQRARLHVAEADGSVSSWEAVVTAGRRMPRPECGEDSRLDDRTDTEWIVGRLRHSTHGSTRLMGGPGG